MEIVKVSSKYQVVIPRSIREPMGIEPGQEVAVVRYKDHIHIVPIRSVEDARGLVAGMDSTIEREVDRTL